MGGDPARGLLQWYRDPLPTNCVADWVCPASGSAGYPIFTDTQAKLKKGIVSPHLIPRVAIVDPALTLSAPTGVTAATGMDALTHAVEWEGDGGGE